MKRFTCLTVVLIIGFMLIGCSAMTAEQRKEGSDLTSYVGNRAFVGEPSREAYIMGSTVGQTHGGW